MVFISRLKLRNFKSFKAADIQLPKTFICFAGPNGSGKCVDGDTSIYLADGTTTRIRELVNEAVENGNVEEIEDGYIAQNSHAKEILTLDSSTLKIVKKKIAAFVKREAPDKMLRVTTRSGKEIIATEYHPFFILDNDKIKPIRADQLKEKTRVAIPRRLHINPDQTLFLELLDLIGAEDSIYVPYSEKAARFLLAKKAGNTWRALESISGVPEQVLVSFVSSKQAILFPYLVRVLRICGLSNLEIADVITEAKGRRDGLFKIPWQNSNELCRFLGYLLAEGSVSRSNNQIRFTNGSQEIVTDYVAITRNLFGLDAQVYKYKKGSFDVIINCVALRNILLKFGMSYEGAGGKSIADMVFRHSTNEQLSNLLSGLYAGDGYVSKIGVEITLKSEKLIRGVENILLRIGIVPRTARITKRETKTGFVGSYFKVSISEVENLQKFSENVKIAHSGKRGRLEPMLQKKSNSNVDLLEANSLIKTAARDLRINVKRTKEDYPRLDAYCYNQCLPSRHGVQYLLSKVFRPLAIQKNLQTEALAKLELLAEADIFWDEIEKIEVIQPREKWVYDLTISEHHNFIANGIFVHNSNLCDAIRFAMGETSLRSLRAKKVRDLIHSGSKSAEVTIVFEGENGGAGYQIKRAIREDGKIRYRLDEQRTTRSAILEALKKNNMDDSGRNTIAQGEVQRILSMNGKERRGIIDSVAGIADFEEKKKEAVRELETVETRIKEARLVLGERKAFLDELEHEKEVAIKYIEGKKTLTNAKGTLLRKESERFEKELSEAVSAEEKLTAARKARDEEMAAVEAQIAEVDQKRGKTSQDIQSRQKTNALIRKLEELKASCGSRKQLIEDKKAETEAIDEEKSALGKEAAEGRKAIEELDKETGLLSKDLHAAEKALAAIGGLTEDERVASIRKSMDESGKSLSGARERLASLNSEVESKRQLIAAKGDEALSIAGKGGSDAGVEEDTSPIKNEIARIAKEIDSSFSRTKEINGKMGELDKEMLELKEKASIHKVRASPQLANPALSFIADLVKSREKGIYGIVADLIGFDPKYSNAVEAAGGARLLYVVVDSIDTATSIIERLKKARAGRATFIPLDSVRSPSPTKSGKYASVIEVVEFKEEIRRAAEYVFAETLLVDSIVEAKKLGIGSARMVTAEGEIFERSGIVSGGRSQGGVLGGNQLRKIEEELNGVKATKDSLMQELYSIREDESKLRGEKAQLEIKVKTIEMRRSLNEDRRAEMDQTIKRKEQLKEEIKELEGAMLASLHEKSRLEREIDNLSSSVTELRKKLGDAEQEFLKSTEKTSKERAEASAKASSIRATIEGKASELQLRRSEFAAKEERLRKLEKEEKEIHRKVEEAKKHLAKEEADLARLEEEISSTSKEIEKLFEQMKGFEEELQRHGKARGHIRMELDRITKDASQVGIRKATTSTRLEDIRNELSAFSGFEMLELSRDELSKMVAEAERTLASLGNVNMAAIEMFDKKKSEIEDVEGKIEMLDTEREAILSMISEIDEHKKDAFMEAFAVVSDNFSKMFRHVNVGQGHLYLSDAANPFDSGLFIKLRRSNVEHNLDSLSGGEKTLVALMFIFALQLFKPAPFYILDEVDAALDKPNSKNLADLVAKMSADSQFIVVSHNDTVMSNSDSVIGVTKADNVSKLVGIKLKQMVAQA